MQPRVAHTMLTKDEKNDQTLSDSTTPVNATVQYFSLEGWTWQQQRSSGQSNVAKFFVYFATLDLPWGNLK